jgi:hypothetical protein
VSQDGGPATTFKSNVDLFSNQRKIGQTTGAFLISADLGSGDFLALVCHQDKRLFY